MNGLSHSSCSGARVCGTTAPFWSGWAGSVQSRRRHRRPEEPDEDGPERQSEDDRVGDDRGGLGPPDDRRAGEPHRPEPEGRDEQDDIAAHDVVGRDPAEDEHEGGQRDRRGDEQEHIGQGRQELADDDRERADRRDGQQVEGLLLALEADRACREGRREEDHQERLEHQQRAEDAAPDLGGGVGEPAERHGERSARGTARPSRRRRAEQDQVDRQDDERPPPAHPAAKLLDADGADPAETRTDRTGQPDAATLDASRAVMPAPPRARSAARRAR